MSRRTANAHTAGNSSSSSSSSGNGAGSTALARAWIPLDQLVSLQKRSWQLLTSLDELHAELLMGGDGIVMHWPQLLSRLSGLLSHLVFLTSSLTSPQTTLYSSQLNALEAALRREALTANLFSPQHADAPNEARDAIRAKPYQLPASVHTLRFSDLATASRATARTAAQGAGASANASASANGSSERVGNKLPFLVVHPFEPLPGMLLSSSSAAAAASHANGTASKASMTAPGGETSTAAPAPTAPAPAPAEDPAAIGQHLNYLYNLLRTRPDDTVASEHAAVLRAALPHLLPDLVPPPPATKEKADTTNPPVPPPTTLTPAHATHLHNLQKAHDRAALRALRTWFHLAAATDENGVRYDWKTRVGGEDVEALLVSEPEPEPEPAGEGGATGAGGMEEQEAIMEEDLEEGEEDEEEGEESDAEMGDAG